MSQQGDDRQEQSEGLRAWLGFGVTPAPVKPRSNRAESPDPIPHQSEAPRGLGSWLGFGVATAPVEPGRSRAKRGGSPERKSVWNTYYPWALALYGTISVILLVIILVSWIPGAEIPGVPPSEQSVPVIPGLLGILFFVLAGRQLYLRSESKKP
jgi:hypothetical protein